MKFLMILLATAHLFVVLPCVAKADVLFFLSPLSQSISQGSTGTFDLFISSDTVGGDPIEGIDFNVNAGLGDGSGGVFTAAPTFVLGSVPGDFTTTPGQVFSTNFSTNTINVTSPVLIATLTLDTTGVAPGIYSLTLDSLNAGHPTIGPLPTLQNSVSYEVVIATIPEPTSLAMVAVAGLVFSTRSRRRRS